MIIYFSATGNSKYVAERIARDCNDEICSIMDCDADITLKPNEMLGIVTPVNWWELPVITRDFLSKLHLDASGNNYVFIVVTLWHNSWLLCRGCKKSVKSTKHCS